MGAAPIHGLDALRAAAEALGARNPVGHHVTNVVLIRGADGAVEALSKGLGVNADGSCGSVTYEDLVVCTGARWRTRRRRISLAACLSGAEVVASCVVGVAGFEPTAPRSQSECATKLRYTPSVGV